MGSRVPGVKIGMIRIDGRLDLRRSRLESGSASSFHRRITALSLINAHVNGAVNLNGAEVNAPGEWAVSAGGLVAEGGVYCQDGFVAHGEVRLMGAQLPGGLHMRGALLERPGRRGVALALDNAVASTLDFSDGFTANGTVRLRGARISGYPTFEGAVLNGPPDGHGPSLGALLMQAVDFDFTLARPASSIVDLRGAQVSYLHDSDHCWPDVVELDGFVYDSIKVDEAGERREAGEQRDTVARRVAWIRRSPSRTPGQTAPSASNSAPGRACVGAPARCDRRLWLRPLAGRRPAPRADVAGGRCPSALTLPPPSNEAKAPPSSPSSTAAGY
ncbi:hypothetical protein [Streptomyces sp. NRRL F-2799]|uniref:hypothetical protein n=1 Tax=Streptomyces sp. NRRL F-2799 TaxID=1463844 RepID=UPI001F3F768D|nr:hypothetical protein [Streptomyces sp. NRRL F-2799]